MSYTLWFDKAGKEAIGLVGGKNASLGELIRAEIPVPVTDGSPYSLHTIAAWQVKPPMSVTAALILVKIGAQAGLVVGQTSISPC